MAKSHKKFVESKGGQNVKGNNVAILENKAAMIQRLQGVAQTALDALQLIVDQTYRQVAAGETPTRQQVDAVKYSLRLGGLEREADKEPDKPLNELSKAELDRLLLQRQASEIVDNAAPAATQFAQDLEDL